MKDRPPRWVVPLLTGQAVAFGVTLALLIVPANSIFLDAYGSEWLPATYIAVAVVGSAASAFIARAARRSRLARVAAASLGALGVLFLAPIGLVFLVKNWQENKKSFFIQIAGLAFVVVGAVLGHPAPTQ